MRIKEYSEKIYDKLPYLLILITVITVILCCFSSGISGNDFWWHVKVGEWISENQCVPENDIFSWIGIQNNISWTAHEWLSDVILYKVYSTLGTVGIYGLSIMLSFIMTGLLWFEVRRRAKENLLISGLYFTLFAVLTSLFFYGRPHIFSFFFLFAELKCLYSFVKDQKSKLVYFIPIISVLWSNFHGGSSNLSYILCLITLITGLYNIKIGRIQSNQFDRNSKYKLLCIFIASIVGIFINPIGYKVFLYPYTSFSDQISMTVISEWQAPDAKLIGNLVLYFLPIAIFSICIIAYEGKIRLFDISIMCVFLFLFFRSSRFIILWYISAAFYAFQYLPKCKVKQITKTYEKIVVVICALGLVALMVFSSISIFRIKSNELISKAMSDEAVNAVKSTNPHRIFNDYNFGETLIFNDIPVFFDARADLFAQKQIMSDGVGLMYLQPAELSKEHNDTIASLINKYKFDYVLIHKSRPLYIYIVSHPEEFDIVFEDDMLGYFYIKSKE